MNNLRQDFEKLSEIATHLDHGNVFCDDQNQTYASEFSSLHFVACYVNGAWYAYQQQQKKINSLLDQTCGTHEEFLNSSEIPNSSFDCGEEYDSLRGRPCD